MNKIYALHFQINDLFEPLDKAVSHIQRFVSQKIRVYRNIDISKEYSESPNPVRVSRNNQGYALYFPYESSSLEKANEAAEQLKYQLMSELYPKNALRLDVQYRVKED